MRAPGWETCPADLFGAVADSAVINDLLLARDWFAPLWQCNSLGIPLMRARQFALPYAAIALILSGIGRSPLVPLF